MKFKILETDHLYYITSEDICSRCGRALGDDEVPLMLWPKKNRNYMLVYCDDCIDQVIIPEGDSNET